jgi:D-aminoacyl-tRNA deacylase
LWELRSNGVASDTVNFRLALLDPDGRGHLSPHGKVKTPAIRSIFTRDRVVILSRWLQDEKMRAVIQRVLRAQVTVGEEIVGKIGPGLLVLLGVAKSDSEADADYLASKIIALRIFDDENGKMNLSLADTHGSVLSVSQFTLYGDVRKGRRPSFDEAAPPPLANELYEDLVGKIRESGVSCETGRFQAMMEVELVNDGPVTILLDSTRVF